MTAETTVASRAQTLTRETGRRVGAMFPLGAVVLPWLMSRLLSAGLLILMSPVRSPLSTPFVKWDGGWYLHIAMFGYGPTPVHGVPSTWAFFPFLAWTVKATHSLGISWWWSGVVVNHLAFLLALAGLWRIANRHTTERGARLAVWAIVLFPGAFLFSMVYPCSIFLAASVWAFIFVDEHRDLAAGVVAVAATLVRPNGAVLAVALAVAIRFRPRRMLLVCGPSAAAFIGWCIHNSDRTGDALAFYHAKSGWPEVDLFGFLTGPDKNSIPHLLLAGTAILAVVLAWRRLPRAWLVFTALYLLPSFYTGMVGLGRYAGECFPAFVAAGDVLARWPKRAWLGLFAASIALQALCAYWVIHQEWVP